MNPFGIVFLHGVFRWAAGIAVRHSRAILEGGVRVRIFRCFELRLQKVNSIIQKIGISVTHSKVQLAFEFGPSVAQSRFIIAVRS